jgi:hypothetical protein
MCAGMPCVRAGGACQRRAARLRCRSRMRCAAAHERGCADAPAPPRALRAADLSLIRELCAEAGLAGGAEAAEPSAKRRRRDAAAADADTAAAPDAAAPVPPALAYVLVYELLFGGGVLARESGEAAAAVCDAEAALRSALARRLKQARASLALRTRTHHC